MDQTPITQPVGASGTDDAGLVAAALAGDPEAIGRIYDRYADRVHTMCVHMLSNRSDAADVCGDVFLTAFQRLDQLKDPSRLKPWLFAITRHAVYRRTKQRGRIDLIEEVDEMDRLTATAGSHSAGGAGSGTDPIGDEVDTTELAAVVHQAADGLDEKDRAVMELQLQGLDGEDLAAALGVSTSTGYQQVHRMKERLERSLGALLVARRGRQDCADLDRLLSDWDGQFSVLWRKRVARHIDGCEVCERSRKAVPAMLLGGAALAAPMVGAGSVSAAPALVRERVLREASPGAGASGRRWTGDGFPPADGTARRTAYSVLTVLVVLALIALVIAAFAGGDEPDRILADADTTTSVIEATITSTTASSVPSSTTSAVTQSTPPPTTPVAPPTTVVPDVVGTGPPPPTVVAPPPTTVIPVPPPLADPPPPRPGPSVQLTAGPSTVFHPTVGFPSCGASTSFIAVSPDATAVELWWTAPGSSGVVPMERVGPNWQGVIEVAPAVGGPLQIVAVASAAGASSSSAARNAVVANCPTPG